MKNYTNFRLFFILLVIFYFSSEDKLFSQYMPVLTTERGDTLQYTYPIPDSVYKPDEIIIKIRPSALNLNNLCYTIPSQYDPTL